MQIFLAFLLIVTLGEFSKAALCGLRPVLEAVFLTERKCILQFLDTCINNQVTNLYAQPNLKCYRILT